jgi:DNA repair exonuclease SbcCD ATPase subunit
MSASAVDENGQAVEPGKTYNDHIGNSDEEMAQLKSRVEELEEALAKCNTGAQNKSDISQRELDKSLFQHEELKGTNERMVVEIEHLKSQELESASQMEEIQCQHELAKQKHDRAIAETQHMVQAEKSNVASLETILQGKQHSLESLQAELKEVRQESLERQKLQEQESKGARTRIHYLGGLVRDMSQEMSLVNHKYEPKVTPEEQTEVESLTAALQDSEQKQIDALETLHKERVAFAARIHEVNTLLHNVATKENSTTNV